MQNTFCFLRTNIQDLLKFPVSILIDGSFLLPRYQHLKKASYLLLYYSIVYVTLSNIASLCLVFQRRRKCKDRNFYFNLPNFQAKILVFFQNFIFCFQIRLCFSCKAGAKVGTFFRTAKSFPKVFFRTKVYAPHNGLKRTPLA